MDGVRTCVRRWRIEGMAKIFDNRVGVDIVDDDVRMAKRVLKCSLRDVLQGGEQSRGRAGASAGA